MKLWLEINFILAFSYLLFWAIRKNLNLSNKYYFERASFFAIVAMMIFPFFLDQVPQSAPLPPVITKQVVEKIQPSIQAINSIKIKIIPNDKIKNSTSITVEHFLLMLILFGFISWLFRFYRDFKKINFILSESIIIKKCKRVKIYLSPNLKVPCSFWLPNRYYVLIPQSVISSQKMLSHAISHELQHHRQADTKLIYLIELFRALFYLNPFTHLWINRFFENRELKCDQEVLERKSYSVREYGKTLIDVANINTGIVLNRTWAMASLTKIKRRIEMIKISKTKKLNWQISFACISLTMLLTWQALATTRNLTNLKSFTIDEARELVSKMNSTIPIEMNETVLKWLNYFMADPKGKAYVLKTFQRMHQYKQFISEKLNEKKMPLELLAVPFMESGYDNSRISSAKAAGLWQFIPETARKYGLRVDKKEDERFHVGRETQAAIKYYSDLINIKEFDQDWRLALIAYNSGEGALKRAIRRQGTKDPWAFNELGDKEYLAKIMAGIILLKKTKMSLFSHPLKSGRVTSSFGMRKNKSKKRVHHSGLDIAAKLGTSILSPLPGMVKVVETRKGYGKSVIIDHGNNIETRYYHLHSFNVHVGEKVIAEQKIGTVGSTGISTGPHLHLEVLINGKKVDPEIYF